MINDKGDIVGKYNKVHLYHVKLSDHSLNESSFVEKGNDIVPPVPTPVGNVGLSIVSFSATL